MKDNIKPEAFLEAIKLHILNEETFVCCCIDGYTRLAVLEDPNNVIIDFVASLEAKEAPNESNK